MPFNMLLIAIYFQRPELWAAKLCIPVEAQTAILGRIAAANSLQKSVLTSLTEKMSSYTGQAYLWHLHPHWLSPCFLLWNEIIFLFLSFVSFQRLNDNWFVPPFNNCIYAKLLWTFRPTMRLISCPSFTVFPLYWWHCSPTPSTSISISIFSKTWSGLFAMKQPFMRHSFFFAWIIGKIAWSSKLGLWFT